MTVKNVRRVPTVSSQAQIILEKRYLLEGETVDKFFRRVAKAVAEADYKYGASELEVEKLASEFKTLMEWGTFLPNSPTLMNAGANNTGTLSACYVLPLNDDMEEIMQTASDQAMVEKFGGGVGFPLSNLRPRNALIRSTHGKACGPIEVLKTLSQVGRMITQGGKRDGAHMAVMSVYHPDIEEFIGCKSDGEEQFSNFNISVGVDSNFMRAVEEDLRIHLTWPMCDEIHTKESAILCQDANSGNFPKARDLFSKIIHGAWANGEPGMIWFDRMEKDNVTPHLASIQACNPCGEQPLLPNESCNLGSINLGHMIDFSSQIPKFNEERFRKSIQYAVHFLDNVVDINNHPTEATQDFNGRTRKIGLGVMGWADLLVRMHIPYDSMEALVLATKVGAILKEEADNVSSDLGAERGSFPEFENSTLSEKWEHMRNAWRLSLAPTGTISMIADCSSGIEPLFALSYKKHNLSAALEGEELFYINRDLQELLKEMGVNAAASLEAGISLESHLDEARQALYVTAHQLPYDIHIRHQAAWQEFVDSGISKTINLPNDATKDDVWNAYMMAWKQNCKGITVYRDGSRDKEVLVATTHTNGTGSITDISTEKVDRIIPTVVKGERERIKTGNGTMHVNINFDDAGKPFELFANLGKTGGCEHGQLEAIGRLVSLALQSDVPIEKIIHQLRGITCCPIWDQGKQILSPADAVAHALQRVAGEDASERLFPLPIENSTIEMKGGSSCPECYSPNLYIQEGCEKCSECGFSRCG